MKHVIVESNWLYDVAAPRVMRKAAALELLDAAQSGSLRLPIPSIYFGEARRSILRKCRPKSQDLRAFRRWARVEGLVTAE